MPLTKRDFLQGSVAACAAAATGLGPDAAAAKTVMPVVVELFTSQGCSACPPADKLLARMAGREDVIPLALHIDYWDYIGWKDKFAQSAFTKRQKAYARSGGHRVVYTPQMMINGRDNVIGNRPMEVADLIQQHKGKPARVALDTAWRQGSLRITAAPRADLGPIDLHVVRYLPEETVNITRGENAGLKAVYSHIVTDWSLAGTWQAGREISLEVDWNGTDPIVILAQGHDYGPMLGAKRLTKV